MKLDEIPAAMLAKAIEIYLEGAYEHQEPPARVRQIAAVEPDAPLAAALEKDHVAKIELVGRPGFIDKYRWRLGNAFYPHMKLGLERCSEADDFVFVVDTHDRNFPLGSPALEDPAFLELLERNAELKQAIEARWDLVGIPTFNAHISRYLRDRCVLPGTQARTILVVDDDEAVLELEQALLEEAGYRVIPASGGYHALGEIARLGAIDLCLLDIMMPTLDGLTVARRARAQGLVNFAIVCVTALPRERVDEEIIDDYIGKPFDPDRLLEVIRRYIG